MPVSYLVRVVTLLKIKYPVKRKSGQIHQTFLHIPAEILRLFNQNFAASQLKWLPNLSISAIMIYFSDVFALLLNKLYEILDKISYKRKATA